MQTVTLTGKFESNEKPCTGKVVIRPSVNTISDTAGNLVKSGPWYVDLDSTGAFSIDLPATDDNTLVPTDFGYTLECQFNEAIIPAINFQLPAALLTQDVTELYGVPTTDGWTPVVKAGLELGDVENLAPGVPGYVDITGEFPNQIINFGLAQGIQGIQGVPGNAATADVGATNTVAPGTPANVTNVGTLNAAIFDFDIPQGQKGDKGDKGDPGSGNVDSVNGDVGPDVVLTAADVGAEPTVNAGTASQYYRGDKTWAALNKAAVGLGNVDDTSDANKPISTATQNALNAKLDELQGTLTAYRETTVNNAVAAFNVDFNTGNIVNVTTAGAVTITWANIPAGTGTVIPMTIRLASSVTSVTWPAGTKFAGGAAPTLNGETWITAVAFNGVVTVGLAWDGVA